MKGSFYNNSKGIVFIYCIIVEDIHSIKTSSPVLLDECTQDILYATSHCHDF